MSELVFNFFAIVIQVHWGIFISMPDMSCMFETSEMNKKWHLLSELHSGAYDYDPPVENLDGTEAFLKARSEYKGKGS